jgi:hypothetical protein
MVREKVNNKRGKRKKKREVTVSVRYAMQVGGFRENDVDKKKSSAHAHTLSFLKKNDFKLVR